MSNISSLRDTADYLLKQDRPYEASIIYSEIYRQIWNSIAAINDGLNSFSKIYLPKKVMTNIEFRNNYSSSVSSTIFYQWFQLDSDQVLNEFIFTLNGHLKCVTYSKNLIHNHSRDEILNEFSVLYTLINYSTDENWVDQILKYVSIKHEPEKINKPKPNLLKVHIEKKILKITPNIVNTDWNHLNYLLADYLHNKGERNTQFYKKLVNTIGKRPSGYSNNYRTEERYERKNAEGDYTRYEKYERYERYEKFERKTYSFKKKFDPKTASEEEKARHYGRVLELSGAIKKEDIRKKYISLVGQYHPDRVEGLGKDLRELADERTKELNEAYDWMRSKYNL